MARNALVKRLVVIAVLAAAALGLGVRQYLRREGSAADPRLNVLLITLDTTRADHLRCYGYTRATSPNLDALAADGVRFELALSPSAVTPMSHASIFTGLNPDRHGLRVFYGKTGYFLSESEPTLASLLRSQGWETGAFVSAYSASQRFGLHWGFNTFQSEVAESVFKQDMTLRPPKDGYWSTERVATAQRRSDETTDHVLGWLKSARRPFFLWTHYWDPHDAALVPPEQITSWFGAHASDRPDIQRNLYDAEVFFVDMQIGRLLSYLKERGELEKTIIAVVADHGQGLGDHSWWLHRLLYQEQIRLPLIMRVPGGPRGMVIPSLVRSTDIAPTVLDLIGLPPLESPDGASLCGLMKGQPEPPRIAYAEALNTLDVHTPEGFPPLQQDLLFCVVEEPWKLIYHKEHPGNSELYNLATDPRESSNVVDQNPEVKARLLSLLEKSGIMEIEMVEPMQPMDQETYQKLRSLGYIGK
jgi:arylsulfatase A-like enzyme